MDNSINQDNGHSVRIAQIHGDLAYAKCRLAQDVALPYGRGPTADISKTHGIIHWSGEVARLENKLAAGTL